MIILNQSLCFYQTTVFVYVTNKNIIINHERIRGGSKNMKNKTDLNKKCGTRLKEMRKAKGLTQRELAESIPCTEQYISSLENAKRPICELMACELARVLNVRPEYLLCIDDYKEETERYRSLSEKDSLMRCLTLFIDHTGYEIDELESESISKDSNLMFSSPPVEKWIIRDSQGNYNTCTRENIYELLEDIQGYIEFRLKKFSSKCSPATKEEIDKFEETHNGTQFEILQGIGNKILRPRHAYDKGNIE